MHAAHDHILRSLAVESAFYVSIYTNMPTAAIVLRCDNTIIRVWISLKIYSWTSIAVINFSSTTPVAFVGNQFSSDNRIVNETVPFFLSYLADIFRSVT